MKALLLSFLLATASLPGRTFAGRWEWHHAEKVWVNDDGSWHYKNDKLTGSWKKYIERHKADDAAKAGKTPPVEEPTP